MSKPMGRPIKLLQPGETFSYIKVIKCDATEWLGEKRTTYTVKLLCCGQVVTRSHKQLVLLRRQARASRCIDCVRGRTTRSADEPTHNEREVLGLLQRRERAEREKAARIAARRAANQAAVDAAHRRAIGEAG